MPNNPEYIALVQFSKDSWKYGYLNPDSRSIVWKDLSLKITKTELSEVIKEKLNGYREFILLPPTETQINYSDKETVLLVTKGSKSLLSSVYPDLAESIWEVDESINIEGKIEFELTEPEINKALRFIFTRKPNTLVLCLTNSIFNSTHEKNLQNVLRVAGYKAFSGLSINSNN